MRVNQLLIGINVLIFAAMLAVAGSGELQGFSSQTLLEFGANYTPLVRDGQWWRAITSMFIHVEALHLGMNMLALYQVGTLLEPHFGRLRYVLLYLAAGLGGSAATLGWHWANPNVSAGASGAISGLIGAGIVAGHLIGSAPALRFRDAMIRWAAITFIFGLAAHIDNAAHLGGFIVGGGVAWLMDRGGAALVRREQSAAGIGLEGVLLLAVVGVGFGLAGRSREASTSVEELVNRGVALSRAGKDDEAIAAYQRALHMNPNDDIAHFDLALALRRRHDWAGAEQHARRATELDGAHKEAWSVLAEALNELGRTGEAKAALDHYVKLGGKLAPDDD